MMPWTIKITEEAKKEFKELDGSVNYSAIE